uniref:Aminopeptidase n=1 Tax=Stegastes partitus TaxID=144197 RepID=A0A3B4ZL34_9TELE
MPSKSGMSKAFAVAFVVLTVSVIAGTVTMFILYEIQMHGVNATAQPTFPATTEPPPPVLRLGKSVVPVRYSLSLRVGLYTRIIQEVNVTSPNQTLSFSGNSTVHFRCAQRTNSIFLHGLDLLVSDPQVKHTDTGRTVGSSLKKPDKKSRFLEVGLKDFMEVGEHYSLTLSFEGELSENLEALYVSQYREEDLEFLAATYLEPTGARKMFPCFDEPEMKAEFDVKIIHRRDTTALNPHFLLFLSETGIVDEEWKFTTFQRTPKMSTYLLAFTVSEFRSVRSPVTDERTFARPEAIAAGHTAYASEITRKILEFYERRFQIEYELNKLDQIALPDLDPAAMENWGLVTYQEGHLLYEEGVSSMLHKEVIAVMIAHELAHQWFGNLVTMKWWNNIWLNEGFATYMSYFAVDDVEPSFKMTEVFIMDDLHEAFEEDALASSHPLILAEQDVETPDAISGLFDAITYSKVRLLRVSEGIPVTLNISNSLDSPGLNIDRLVHRWQGRHFKFGQSVENLMAPWTKQAGYPVITIDTTNGEIYQKRFLFSDTAESSLVWHIPIRFIKEEFISKDSEWILANVNSFGYYRVNYNLENWQRLLHQLETKPHLIPLMNRGQLVDDAFNLARAKLVDVTLALNSTRFLRHETEFLPWESALRNLEYFVLMFDRSEVYGPMQVRTPADDRFVTHNQINAVMLACANGLPECIEMATYKFAEWMEPNGTNTIHPNLRSVIYCQAVAAGGRAEWEFAWDKLQSSSDTSEKEQLRGALACTKKIWLLNRYLQYTLDPDKIRLMDVASIITDVATNSAGQALAWNFMRAHWDYVSQGDASLLIQGVTSRFSTPFELEELERFADVYELGSGVRAAQQAIEQTRVNIEWVNNNKDAVLQWFEAHTEEERYH